MKKVVFDLPIYTYQIDFAGHVSNIVYLQWMEMKTGFNRYCIIWSVMRSSLPKQAM